MDRTLVGALSALLAIGASMPARSQDDSGYVRRNAIIHSDVPLWGQSASDNASGKEQSQEHWPQHFYAEDGSFGCSTVVSAGVWRYLEHVSGRGATEIAVPEPAGWFHFGNQGVFHCAATVANDYAEDLEDANLGRGRLSFFVNLGTFEMAGRTRQLWAIQMGLTPGSDYLLLARDPAEQGIIRRFDVLQRICPKANLRTGGSIDSFLTDYCAINTREDLVELAVRMAKHEPLGELKWFRAEPAEPAD